MIAVILLKNDGKYFLLCDRDGNISGKEDSTREIVKDMEASFNQNHDRGYEASMSVCIFHVMIQPKVIEVPDMKALHDLINVYNDETMQRYQLYGFNYGLLCKQELAEQYWEKGIEPRLISPD